VRLFIEEVDKITSLIIGLSSRLVRVSLHPSSRDMEPRDQVLTPSLCYLSCRLVRVSLHPSSREMEPRDQVLARNNVARGVLLHAQYLFNACQS